MTRIGQKTGMLKKSKKVQNRAIMVALVAEYQNLNSGSRLERKPRINYEILCQPHLNPFLPYEWPKFI